MFIGSLVAGCSDTVETVELYKMENFSDKMEDTKVVYSNELEVKQFKSAVKSARQQPGIADMAEPHFMFEIGEDSYFLWLHEDHATIMDSAETHTIYTVNSTSVEALNDMID